MLLKRCGKVSGRVSHARRRRAVSIPIRVRASASASATSLPPSSTPAPGLALLPLSLAVAPPIDRGPLPLSYRTITTDPVFRPVVGSDQQYAPGPPQLLSRHITLNPLHGLMDRAGAQAGQLDLAFAAAMDRTPLAHVAAAAATAALTYLGLHPLSLLRLGLPEVMADWLETRLGEWVLPLAGAAAIAAGLSAALWQLRTWVATHLTLIRFNSVIRAATEARVAATAGATSSSPLSSPPSPTASSSTVSAVAVAAEDVRQSAPEPSAPSGHPLRASTSSTPFSSSSTSSPVATAAVVSFLGLVPEPLRGLFEEGWKSTDRTWLLLIMAGRLSTLCTAASGLLCGTVAAAVLCFGASLLPLALPHIRKLLAASQPLAVPGGAAGLAASALLADAAFLLALAPAAPPPVRAVAAAVLAAGSALTALTAAASTRLTAAQAVPGDTATFHVIVRLPMSGTLIDTTWGHRPLTAVVGGDAADVDTGVSTVAAAAAPSETPSDPQARFRPMQTLLAAATLPGMYLGERRTVVLAVDSDGADGDGLPFRNPGLVWWQPQDDMQRKVGSAERALCAGDVFWYPVGSLVSGLGSRRLSTATTAVPAPAANAAAALAGADSWGPVEVCAVSEGWVELDANAGLKGGQAEVEVQLVALEKR